ncbi:MAG: cytochrome P450 [Streptosporangiales bacterium]|nr:cytochrome P450 [Streptosporangiales bacterium]
MVTPNIPEGFDFTDPDLNQRRLPAAELAELRRTAPVWWSRQPRGTGGFDDDGYWVVTRHADVQYVSRNSGLFSSAAKTAIIRYNRPMTPEELPFQRLILLNADPPDHTRLRSIVSRGFTPRAIGNLRQALADRAGKIMADTLEGGTGDFVIDVARELPLQAIADLLGIPQADRHQIFEWSNQMIGAEDPEYKTDEMNASAQLIGYSMQMAEERRKCPADDIVTKLTDASAEGGSLSADEFGWFVLMLSVAGNETTRNAITHGMLAFLEHPDQWELYRSERPQTAADEIVRWATPVTSFQRTATADTELGGQEIKEGQRVGIFYRSANFDEEVFDHPGRFDITRDPNPHLGFGGTGTHFCLGASLARLEIELMFGAIADALPGIAKAGEPERLRSGWLNGIKHLPVRYR